VRAGTASLRLARKARKIGISLVQQGLIAQNEFAKLVMMGSLGLIELAIPLTDEDRRDFEIHIHGLFGSALAVQVKSVLQLLGKGKARYLQIRFDVRASRLVTDPLFYYFFAFLDPATMRFADPVFLIPSTVVHEGASPKKSGGFWHFTLQASMASNAHDRWQPYRVNTLELGQKLLDIMREQRKLRAASPAASRILEIPDIVWIRKR
jgi:hypothetical protein